MWVDKHDVARFWPSASEKVPFADKGRHAVCFYESSIHKHYNDENALERGFHPRGFVHFYQDSPKSDVFVHWNIEGLRHKCWTEGHIHYKGDLHYDLLAADAIYENVHINPYQGLHDENVEDRNKDLNRHMGDITLLQGDKNGRADVTRYDKLITLYGRNAIYGRMCDLHFPKSCFYDAGFHSKENPYPNQMPLADYTMVNIVNEAAQQDPDGLYSNDKRGIAFGVIGHVDEDWVDEYLYGDDGLFNGGDDNKQDKKKKRSSKSRK